MADYIPSPAAWVRDQVELYEGSRRHRWNNPGARPGLPVIVVTNRGNRTGAIRKTPLMRVTDGNNYVLVGSKGGAPKNPVWVYNLRAHADVEIQDETAVHNMRVREVERRGGTGAVVGTVGCGFSTLRGVSEQDVALDSGVRRGAGVGGERVGWVGGGSNRGLAAGSLRYACGLDSRRRWV